MLHGRVAARSLMGIHEPYAPDHYFWTEQFGLDVKTVGELTLQGTPILLEGDPSARSLPAQWHRAGVPVAATINLKMPIVRFERLAKVAVERG